MAQYAFQNVFSGEIIYESWMLSFYNVFFTVLPPLAIGILDQYVSARLLDRYPQLYTAGQRNEFFKIKTFAAWIANAFYHSLILYIFSELIWHGDGVLRDGTIGGHWLWGTGLYASVLTTVLGKAALVTSNWTKYHIIAIPGSLLIWFAFLTVYSIVAPMVHVSTELRGIIPVLFTSPHFYIQTIFLPLACLIRDVAWKYVRRMYYPRSYHHIQEIQKYNIQDYRPR